MKKLLLIPVILLLLSTISCSNDKSLFKTEIVEVDNMKTFKYEPKMNFETLVDSSYNYLITEDYQKILYGTFSKGGKVYNSDRFDIRILLYTYQLDGTEQKQFILRSFSKDFKIIDSYILADTANEQDCEAIVTKELTITNSCDDGSKALVKIDDYGKFIKQ